VTVGGGRDSIDCGPGFDRVYADGSDKVASNCERAPRDRVVPSPPRRAERGNPGAVACASQFDPADGEEANVATIGACLDAAGF